MRIKGMVMAAALAAFPVGAQVSSGAYNGYLLYSVSTTKTTYLRNNNGDVLHSWTHTTGSGYSSKLLADGTLIRGAVSTATGITGAGATGVIEAVGKTGNILWQFPYKSSNYVLHHYIEVMPNGHVLGIAWEVKTRTQALVAGVNSSGNIWPDEIIEVAGPDKSSSSARIVWEWHAWDHLVPAAQAAANPQRFSVALRASGTAANAAITGDWMHLNGISYDPVRDEIAFSSHSFNEIYVIDHSTTTAEAAGRTGGRRGKGGDLLYRWGAPSNYGAPGKTFFDIVHEPAFVPDGLPGAGHIVVINNGVTAQQSRCVEIALPRDSAGNFSRIPDSAFGPAAPSWAFTTAGYYNPHTGSAQRLPNGNTLCVESEDSGKVWEITPAGAVAWLYRTSTTTAGQNTMTGSAYKYAPDDPAIVALIGATAIRNPLLHGISPGEARRTRRFIEFRGVTGTRIEVYSTEGRRRFSTIPTTDDFRWPVASPREYYLVRIIRDGKVRTTGLAPSL